MGLGQFHHPGRGAQVKVGTSAYQLHANHLLATVAQIRPSIIVAPSWKGVTSGRTHNRTDDCWVFGTLQAYLNISPCVCVFKCVLKGQGVWWKSALFEFTGESAHVSTRLRLLLEAGDGAGQQDSLSDSADTNAV